MFPSAIRFASQSIAHEFMSTPLICISTYLRLPMSNIYVRTFFYCMIDAHQQIYLMLANYARGVPHTDPGQDQHYIYHFMDVISGKKV